MTWYEPILTAEDVTARQRAAQLTDEQKARQAQAEAAQAEAESQARIRASEQAFFQRLDRGAEQTRHTQHGRALLGLVDHDGQWQRYYGERVDGLPAGVVEAARRAVAAEAAAHQAVAAAEQRVRPRVAQIADIDEAAARGEWARLLAEPIAAARQATAAADRACQTLGDVALQLASIRAERAAIPGRIKARRQECAQQEAADLRADSDLLARLARFGLTE